MVYWNERAAYSHGCKQNIESKASSLKRLDIHMGGERERERERYESGYSLPSQLYK